MGHAEGCRKRIMRELEKAGDEWIENETGRFFSMWRRRRIKGRKPRRRRQPGRAARLRHHRAKEAVRRFNEVEEERR